MATNKKAVKPKISYWDKRAAERMKTYDKAGDAAVGTIYAAYKRAIAQIDRDAQRIFATFGREHGMNQTEAMAYLKGAISPSEAKALTNKALRLLETTDYSDEALELLARVNAPAYAARISRLEALKADIQLEMAQVADVQLASTRGALTEIAEHAYWRTSFDMQKGTHIYWNVAGLPTKAVKEILTRKWSGENYSKRIWQNNSQIADTIQTALVEAFTRGRASAETFADVKALVNKATNKTAAQATMAANRLIRTEANYVAGQSEQMAYEDAGFDRYQYVATLDMHTSSVCAELDGKVFPISEQQVGVNMHPMHPWCRSTTRPYIEGRDMSRLKRWSRDADGKVRYVSGNMTYKQWREQQGAGFDNLKTMMTNEARDQAQYQRYSKVLGNTPATESFESFQKMKYAGDDSYKLVKLDYERKNELQHWPEKGLPSAGTATAADDKFAQYLFNPENPHGYAKGIAFTERLGYNKDNWTEMRDEIYSACRQSPARMKGTDVYGTSYEQYVVLYGKNNRPMNVKIGWKSKDGKTWLTTAMPQEVKKK